jgi:signal transduction histidine kinase
MIPVGNYLRAVLYCISQSSSEQEALQGICRIAVQHGRFSVARIGRHAGSRGQISWIAEATDERGGNHIEVASIAIVSNGLPWGILSAFRASDDKSSVEDVEMLKDTCIALGLALESRRISEPDHSTDEESLLSKTATALAHQLSLHQPADSAQSSMDFLAAVAHDLRSPLTGVIGFSGIMLQGLSGPLNAEQQKQLEMIRASGRRLLDLIDAIFSLAKLSLGQTRVHVRSFDLNDTVRSMAARAQPMCNEKGFVLLCELPPARTPVVSDPKLIEQSIWELLDNAIKFTERGNVKLTVSTLQAKHTGNPQTPAADCACVQIIDTGIGIAPTAMARLFSPFGHAGHGKTHPQEGSRLGLALCKALIQRIGGTIHVESHPGRGSRFTIHLPFQWQREIT